MKAPRNSRLALIKRRHRRDLWFTAFAAMMANSDIDCVIGMEPTEVGHRTANRIPLLEAADPVTVVPLTKLREWRPRIRTSAMRNQPPIGALEGKRAPVKLSDDEKHSRWLDCMQRIAEAPPRPPAKPRRQVSQWRSQPRTGELAKPGTRPPAEATDNVPRATVDAVLADVLRMLNAHGWDPNSQQSLLLMINRAVYALVKDTPAKSDTSLRWAEVRNLWSSVTHATLMAIYRTLVDADPCWNGIGAATAVRLFEQRPTTTGEAIVDAVINTLLRPASTP